MANTARQPASLELARYEQRLIQSLKEVQSGCTAPARDTYVINLCADLLSKARLACIRQLVAILFSFKKRGAPKSSAKAFADEWQAVIEDMYGEETLDCNAVNMDEETAEGPHETAQMRLMHEKNGPAARAFLSANRIYEAANDRLERFAHTILSGSRA